MGKRSSNKGSAFERKFCKDLSLWWTDGERDDVFWRTHGSGGRATQRTKKGKETHGQYGDVCATDPIGDELLDWIVFELKKGYSKASPIDLFNSQNTVWRKLIEQAWETSEDAKCPYFALIHFPDYRKPMAWVSFQVDMNSRFDEFSLDRITIDHSSLPCTVVGFTLEDFFSIYPQDFINILRDAWV